ncbi:MAG: D-aminoacyl-tRNA deacylase [Pseudonocardiaceae bacterium]
MRAVVSRVTEAAVLVDGAVIGELTGPGLLVLLAVTHEDGPQQADTMARKLHELRILRDERSVSDTADSPGGEAGLLVVSQFTLYGATRKGRRPSFTAAARPEHAEPLVEAVVSRLRARGATVRTGRFGAMMAVHSVADGPYTVLLDVDGPSRATDPGRADP